MAIWLGRTWRMTVGVDSVRPLTTAPREAPVRLTSDFMIYVNE